MFKRLKKAEEAILNIIEELDYKIDKNNYVECYDCGCLVNVDKATPVIRDIENTDLLKWTSSLYSYFRSKTRNNDFSVVYLCKHCNNKSK